MRFAEHLGSHLTPEWRSQYVQYERFGCRQQYPPVKEIKKFIYAAEEKAPQWENVPDRVIHDHFERYDEGFFLFIDKELNKVNTFFAEKLAEAQRRFNELELEVANSGAKRLKPVAEAVEILHNTTDEKGNKVLPKDSPPTPKKKLKELKFLASEFYLSLILIQNFQQLNFTAFRKILKKHDKIFKTSSGAEYRIAKVETSLFYTNKDIEKLILDTETIAIEDLEHGNRGKAMKRLRVPPLSERQSHVSSFFCGIYTGIFFVLVVAVIITAYNKADEQQDSGEWKSAVRMYRGLLIAFIMCGFLGVNVQGWQKAGVNHVLIFELDPRHHLSFINIIMLAMMFGVVWCISVLAYLFSEDLGISRFGQPLALTVFVLLYLFNPTKTLHYRARRWFLAILFRIVTAPYYPVKFADFWLADQLNSLVVPLLDFQFIFCFYVYSWDRAGNDASKCVDPKYVIRPIIALLPAWFRLAQCFRRYYDTKKAFPHLVNAGKYTTGMVVTIFSTLSSIYSSDEKNALFYIWICTLIISTFYTLTWDIRMDWGLLAKNAGENKYLREQIVYDYKAYYYVAIATDVIFRFLWTLTVSIQNTNFIDNEFFLLFIGTCEAFRRFVWNFFRLENEHLNNVGEFRAVRDISVKIIGPDDHKKDEMNGAFHNSVVELESAEEPTGFSSLDENDNGPSKKEK